MRDQVSHPCKTTGKTIHRNIKYDVMMCIMRRPRFQFYVWNFSYVLLSNAHRFFVSLLCDIRMFWWVNILRRIEGTNYQ
jgi:hypothetical protein